MSVSWPLSASWERGHKKSQIYKNVFFYAAGNNNSRFLYQSCIKLHIFVSTSFHLGGIENKDESDLILIQLDLREIIKSSVKTSAATQSGYNDLQSKIWNRCVQSWFWSYGIKVPSMHCMSGPSEENSLGFLQLCAHPIMDFLPLPSSIKNSSNEMSCQCKPDQS